MDRRKFLKQVSLWSAGIIITPPVFTFTPKLFASSLIKPDIIVAKGRDYPEMVRQVVQSLGSIKSFVQKGDKVVIKPNIGWDRSVDQGANTHPVVVAEIAKLCLDAGASRVNIFDRTCNEERRCYNNSGIKAALKEIQDNRLHLDYIDARKFIPVNIKNGKILKEWSFYKDIVSRIWFGFTGLIK